MAKITVHCFVTKQTAGGLRYYWQPSATLKKAGWKPLSLGRDEAAAIDAARARNAEVEAWRGGGLTPVQIARHAKKATVRAMIVRFREEELPKLAATTRKTYGSGLNRIEAWAGAEPARAITRKNVRDLRDAMTKGRAKLGEHAAHATLKVGRVLFKWAKDQELVDANPFTGFDLATPPPRHQVWDDADLIAFEEAAMALGYPSMAYAVELATWTGQREGDLIKLTQSQWREAPALDDALRAALAGDDGRVMCLELRQNKSRRWVGVPLAGDVRAGTEAAIAVNRSLGIGTTTLLVNDFSGLPWQQRHFIRTFSEVRAYAIALGHQPLADLQFRDLRRTCVVRLGRLGLNDAQISAISGHKLETTKRILETYMPRDHAMAASAVVALHRGQAKPERAAGAAPISHLVGIPTV